MSEANVVNSTSSEAAMQTTENSYQQWNIQQSFEERAAVDGAMKKGALAAARERQTPAWLGNCAGRNCRTSQKHTATAALVL